MATLGGRMGLRLDAVSLWVVRLVPTLTLALVAPLAWLALADRVDPLLSDELVSIQAGNDAAEPYLVLTRRYCATREAEADAWRSFQQPVPGAAGPRLSVDVTSTRLRIEPGCRLSSRRVPIPPDLSPGRWSYHGSLRFCNGIGRCVTRRLEAAVVALEVRDGHWVVSVETVVPAARAGGGDGGGPAPGGPAPGGPA